MYFGRKHGGHSVWEEMKACVSLRSPPVPQHMRAGSLGKPHLQMERRTHWRVLSSAHTQREWLLLLFISLSRSRARCIPLSSKSWRNASEDRPQHHLFCRDGCWTVPGVRRGFGHLAMLHSWTPKGTYPRPFLSRTGVATTKPLHVGSALTLQQQESPQGKGHLSIPWADCVSLEKPLYHVMLE